MDRNVQHVVVKNVNVNTLENVKGIESKIKSFSYFTMLLYLTFKKKSEYSKKCKNWATGWHVHWMDRLLLYPWFRLLSKLDHVVDFGGRAEGDC